MRRLASLSLDSRSRRRGSLAAGRLLGSLSNLYWGRGRPGVRPMSHWLGLRVNGSDYTHFTQTSQQLADNLRILNGQITRTLYNGKSSDPSTGGNFLAFDRRQQAARPAGPSLDGAMLVSALAAATDPYTRAVHCPTACRVCGPVRRGCDRRTFKRKRGHMPANLFPRRISTLTTLRPRLKPRRRALSPGCMST